MLKGPEPHTGSASVINTETYRLKKQVRAGIEPVGMAVDKTRDTVYLTDYADDTLTFFTQK